MIRSSVFILSAVVLLWACGPAKKEHVKTDVAINQVLAESMPGCKYDSMQCAQFEVSYPSFTGLDTAVQRVIKNLITTTLHNGGEGASPSIEAQGEEFIKEYKDFKAETPDLMGRWYRSVSIDVMAFSDSLLSLQVSDESYEGGAHESSATTFLNINPVTGAQVKLADIMKPGFELPLTKAGEEIFKETKELADTANYEFNGFSFNENVFELNQNYGFRKEGIVFFYNSYEIAPYSMGPTEIVIPYERVREWMKF